MPGKVTHKQVWREIELEEGCKDIMPAKEVCFLFVGKMTVAAEVRLTALQSGRLYEPDMPDGACEWEPAEGLVGLRWSGVRRFDDPAGWLNWIIEKILAPERIGLEGLCRWEGRGMNDRGWIVIVDGRAEVRQNPWHEHLRIKRQCKMEGI